MQRLEEVVGGRRVETVIVQTCRRRRSGVQFAAIEAVIATVVDAVVDVVGHGRCIVIGAGGGGSTEGGFVKVSVIRLKISPGVRRRVGNIVHKCRGPVHQGASAIVVVADVAVIVVGDGFFAFECAAADGDVVIAIVVAVVVVEESAIGNIKTTVKAFLVAVGMLIMLLLVMNARRFVPTTATTTIVVVVLGDGDGVGGWAVVDVVGNTTTNTTLRPGVERWIYIPCLCLVVNPIFVGVVRGWHGGKGWVLRDTYPMSMTNSCRVTLT